MGWIEGVHRRHVVSRRVRVLAAHLAPLLPQGGSVLDVGCGDGRLTARLAARRTDTTIQGLDTGVRPDAAIPVRTYEGRRLPQDDATCDAVLLVDVLHHTEDPAALLREARRVARRWVIVKDHTRDGVLAATTLRFMDRVGNARHDVPLPGTYLSESEWRRTFARIGLRVETWRARLGIYPFPFRLFFDRHLHFVARLEAS